MFKSIIWWAVKLPLYFGWLCFIGYAVIASCVSVVALITNKAGMFNENLYPTAVISATTVISVMMVHWHIGSRKINQRAEELIKRCSDFSRLRPDKEYKDKKLNIAIDFEGLFCKDVNLAKQLATIVIQEGHKIGVVTRRPKGDEAVEFFTDLARCQPYYIGEKDREEFFADKDIDIHVWIG